MEKEFIVQQAKRLIQNASETGEPQGIWTEATEFLRLFAGEKSTFYKSMLGVETRAAETYIRTKVKSILVAFIRYVENDLNTGLSIERKAQIDVVSDYLDQAQMLLETADVHPAAPAMIIGASLEEFLRTWVEEENLSLGDKKPSIDTYAKTLREADSIDKQDMKDITSWVGTRNDAAHGKFDQVDDKKRILIMLDGVNLFMRKHSKT